MTILTWLGANARWFLALGSLSAFFLPELASVLRPYLPWLVSMVLGLSMARIDLVDMARNAFRPRFLTRVLLLTLLLMPVTGVVYLAMARLVGLSELDTQALVYLAATPPIASAAGLCFILGYNARLAIEVTLAATILTPVIGPAMVAILIPDAIGISSVDLGIRLFRMIAGAFVFAIVLRRVLSPQRINRNKTAFDGVSAVAMLTFIFPLFDGVSATIVADPMRALWVLALATVFNLGINAAIQLLARRQAYQDRGALGLIWGNRTIAVYLAALPPDPQFTLFVALYQFPMYFTPLLFGRKSPGVQSPDATPKP